MQSAINELEAIPEYQYFGRVGSIQGLSLEVSGAQRMLSVGSRCRIQARDGRQLDTSKNSNLLAA